MTLVILFIFSTPGFQYAIYDSTLLVLFVKNQITPSGDFLKKVINRTTLFGAFFLGTIAVLPNITQILTGIQFLTIGGTALLIAVSVVLDLVKKIDAQTSIREY